MASLNKIMLIGNLGADPEIRTVPSGDKVANFRMATTEFYTNKNGEKIEETEWHRVEFWGNTANVIETYVKKGDAIYVEGKLKTEKYIDANGVEKYSVKIRGNVMQMFGKNNSSKNDLTSTKIEVPAASAEDKLPF